MKLFSKRTITILFILLTTILLGFSLYYVFIQYQTYQKFKKTLNKRELFNNANSLLKVLEKERLDSILYMSVPNSYTLNKLNQQRRKVNLQIKDTKQINLTKEINELLEVRKKVDTISLNYQLLIYDVFHSNINKKIILTLENFNLSKNIQSELQLIRLRENINMEESFIAFILRKEISMNNNDLFFWEKILDLRQLATFSSLKDKPLLLNIQDIYNTNDFSKLLKEARVELFISAKDANYPISFKQWASKSSQQKSKLNHVQKRLADLHTNYLKNELLSHESEVYRSINIFLLVLILLGLFLLILRIFKKMSDERLILKNTVKEIEVDLDNDKKREIKEILTHNSSIEIYEFLAKEIKEPSRAKDLFLANMSHEIRTPLNGIIGFTKELQETKLSEEQEEIIEIIEKSSDNLMHIVNDILDFSKIKAGKINLENILFDPIKKFEDAIDSFVAKAREKEIELKICIDPKIPISILGDPTKITQILTNLISNAIKFTPNKGIIEVDIKQIIQSTLNKSITFQFSVKDSGIGISKEEKKEIFNAFSQADVSTSRKYGGTGLGLSIASQFIKHMGGELKIESQLGEGSRFFFSISLDKPLNLQERSKENLSAYSIGYIPPFSNRSIDENIKTYVEYQNAKFSTYTQRTLLNLKESDLPDLLFIDYKCFDTEGDIEYFLDLPLKIVLIMGDNKEVELLNTEGKIDKVLYKPLNFTRVLNSLEILSKINKESPTKTKNITKKFNDINALVAEDNFINQKLMKNVLNRFGMKVTVVSNGAEALSSRKGCEYDIIFMDIQMPIMGGVEATKNILSFEENSKKKHIPIVALTANALEGDKEKYMEIGMDAYLSKPMDLNELKKVLNNFVG
ncbi:MAG TPA: response regulator [Campylobacterales bacterium]|nr:response regulator [Campylobacterales bacterium]